MTHAAEKIPAPSLCTWTVNERWPHDPNAFTQGLQWLDGALFEGTGLYGESTLREVDPQTGAVRRQIELDKRYFGEGITIVGDSVFQLTWREQTAFRYRLDDFSLIESYRYPGEGWGLTHNNTSLIMSDGTPVLRFINPDDFSEISRVTVRTDRGPVAMLNELEYVDGHILANIWQTSFIVRIDPQTGHVTGVFDFAGLLDKRPAPGVLNGIAAIPDTDKLLITGKNWPFIFSVTPDCP